MNDVCSDNRFEIIAAYKKKLIESTNIETSPDEMAVIDNVLFRFWQIGWLPPVPHGRLGDLDAVRSDMDKKRPGRSYEDAWTLTVIDTAPTIIPADRGDENG